MNTKISPRLAEIIDALPLKKGMRILEIGCGPGVAAREIVRRAEDIYVLAIDRSAKAIQQAKKSSQEAIAAGSLAFRKVPIENFELEAREKLFDMAFAIRVGALDGRHPETGNKALRQIARALSKKGKLFIDGGDPLKEVLLDDYR
jgi:ubiquinone/menaquinone biosynthesis C-methylase UbiE